jgi:carbamate kinase
MRAIEEASRQLAGVLLGGDHLVITYGTASPLGLLGLQTLNGPRAARLELDMLQAQSEGWVGYALELGLRNALPPGAMVVSMVTQTLVDRHDHALHVRDTPVGPVFDKETAEHLAGEFGWRIGPAGRGWCRLVASPEPKDIIEIEAIRRLANTGVTVICAGGGGIPVLRTASGQLAGVEAVVDKEAASALLAERMEADMLVMLTDFGGVYLDYGGPAQRLVASSGVHDLTAHMESFGGRGICNKVKAACGFVTRTGKPAAIGRIADFAEVIAGRRGTYISPGNARISFHDQAAHS